MTTLLVGSEPGDTDGVVGPNEIQLCKYVAATSGIMTEFVWRSRFVGNCCFAVYDDAAGVPNNLLLQDHTSHAAIVGLNTYAVPGIAIDAGAAYWLAVNYDVVGMLYLKIAGGGIGCKYQAWAFHDAFPSPAGGGWNDRVGNLFSAFGYGEPAGQCIWHF